MAPRRYNMENREQQVEETRQRILDAARHIFLEEGFHGTSMASIADRADVARATIYHHFDSKLDLLEALMQETLARAGINDLSALQAKPDSKDTLFDGLSGICRFWAAEQRVFRNLMGLASVDPEARQVIRMHEDIWLRGVGVLVGRLREQGHLRDDVATEEALSVLALLFSFNGYDLLSRRGQFQPSQVAAVMRRLAGSLLKS